MRGLLYKDFLLSRLLIGLLIVLQIGASISCIILSKNQTFDSIDTYLVNGLIFYIPFFLCSITNTEFFKADERHTWCHFAVSTPLAARGQILCKYIMVAIVNASIFVMCLIADFICNKISGADGSAWKILVAYLILHFIINAVEIPFFVRFGTVKGANIKGGLFGLVFSVLFIYFLFGDLTFFREHNFFDWLLELVMTGPDMNKICIWGGIIAVVLYAVSYFISTLLYRRGIEAYEN